MAETETATNVEDLKMNGHTEDSADSSASQSQEKGSGEPKENGVSHAHKESSSSSNHKNGDVNHKSSSKHSSSSSSSKHREGGSSSSSSKHRDGHHSSSSSKHRDGSSHKSSSSSSKSGSSSSHRDGKSSSSSSSSKHREGSSSSSSKPSSSSSSKHKEGSSSSSSSKHRDSSSSSSKPKEGSSSSKDKHSSSSDKHKDRSKESSSSSSRSKDSSSSRSKDGSSSRDKDKHRSSSSSSSKHSSGEKKPSSSSSSKSGESEKKDRHSSPKKSSGDIKPKEEVKDVKIKLESVKEEENHVVDVVEEEESPAEIKAEVDEKPSVVESEPESPQKKPAIKSEDSSDDDDTPLSVRKTESRPTKRVKEESDYEDDAQEDEKDSDEDDDDVPLSARASKAKKVKVEKKITPVKAMPKPKIKMLPTPPPKKAAKGKKRAVAAVDNAKESGQPAKKKKKEEEQEVWRWWEEVGEDTGVKWKYLEHKGPVFAPLYEALPKNVRFYYDGKLMSLSPATEEVATFYGRMLDHDYTTRDVFNKNFLKDWRKVMTAEEKAVILDIKKCTFQEILDHFKKKSEANKSRSKEEKLRIKKENEEMVLEYGFCTIDHHKEKIGNFKIEPPSLFRGRGDHPKQGRLKTRVQPEDVIINCSKDSKFPEPPKGHKWKEVRHDNTVTWLASWNENIQGATKYVMLNAASKLKGQKDWQKYETARKLHKCVDKIRANYQEDWKSKEMRVRQRSVALYFIDKLALRAGNEKDEGESADTVGCCSLRVEHISLYEEKDGKSYVVEFDFLGKDSIRYFNSIPVEKRVFKNLQLFVENKSKEDDLFDRLNTAILNKHLQDLMEGLTAKVFRTYNASRTLSEQLELLTNSDDAVPAMILSYNRANRAVAILCNHQRAIPKSFDKSMENLQTKIESKKEDIKRVKQEIKGIKAEYKKQKSVKTKTLYEKKKNTMQRLEEQLTKLEVQATDKDENKEIALGTSKLNYLDPRISVAWCKKFEVPIEKVYNKTQRDKFRWAIDMATEQFKF